MARIPGANLRAVAGEGFFQRRWNVDGRECLAEDALGGLLHISMFPGSEESREMRRERKALSRSVIL